MPSPQDSREKSGSLKTNNLSKRCVCTRGWDVSTDGAAVGRRTGRGRCWGRGDRSLQRRRCEQWLDILAAQAQLMAPQVVVQRLHIGEDALGVGLFAHDHHVLHLHQGYTVHQHPAGEGGTGVVSASLLLAVSLYPEVLVTACLSFHKFQTVH